MGDARTVWPLFPNDDLLRYYFCIIAYLQEINPIPQFAKIEIDRCSSVIVQPVNRPARLVGDEDIGIAEICSAAGDGKCAGRNCGIHP